MERKITLSIFLGLFLSLVTVNAQENSLTLPLPSILDSWGDYDMGTVVYTNCQWKSGKTRMEMNKISSTNGGGSIQWYAPNGVKYVTNTSNKTVSITVNGVDYGTIAKNTSVDVFLDQQYGDQDTIVMTNTLDGIGAITTVVWADFVDGTTIISAVSSAGVTALNTKDNTVDVATSALTFSLTDEANGIPTKITQLKFIQNEVVEFVDLWRFLEVELTNTGTAEVIPVQVNNNFIRSTLPEVYEIADGNTATFELKIWIKSGISTDLLTRMQTDGAKFTLSMGLADLSLEPSGDLYKYDPAFSLVTGALTFQTQATTVNLIKRDPFIAATKEAYIVVAVTDANSVVDSTAAAIGKTTNLTLSKVSGPGDISSASGLAQVCKLDSAWVEFSDIVFSAAGSYVVQIEASGDYSATNTFTIEVAEALIPVVEWTDFSQVISLPTASLPANADKEVQLVGTERNISDPPEISLAVKAWLDTDPVESFGFIVNTIGASDLVLTQRMTVSGPNSPDSLKIQYRYIDDMNPIDWTDLGGIIVTHWDVYDPQFNGGISLPAEAEDKDSIEIRYLNVSVNNRHGEPGKSGASIKLWDLGVFGVAALVDDVKPVLSAVTAGPVIIGDNISATSNEAGMIYLVPSGTTGDAAAIAAAAVVSGAASADADVALSTTGIIAGDYIVYAVDEADNVSDSSAVITIEEETSIRNADSGILVLYPNPVSDNLHIKGVELKEIMVFDITGKAVISATIDSKSVDVSHLKAGVYLFKATSRKGEQIISRFMKN